MKMPATSKILEVCVVTVLTLIAVAGGQVASYNSVPPDQIPTVLTMILAEGRNNFERVQTWQGEADFTVDIIYRGVAAEHVFQTKTEGKGNIPQSVRKRKVGNIQFVADFEKGYVYENLYRPNPVQYTEFETGRDLRARSPLPWHTVSVITPEHFTQSAPSVYDGTSIKRRHAVREVPQKGSASIMSGVFDPRKCFGARGVVWETLPRLLQKIDAQGKFSVDEYDLEVKERVQGGNIEYRIQIPLKSSQTDIFATMIFSGACGFNIISYEISAQDGNLFQKSSWEYDLVDGIYLPTKTENQNFDLQTGQLRYHEEFIFRNHQLNQAIPDKTFTHENLGLKDGDKFTDKIMNKKYMYQDKKLIPLGN